MNGPVSSEALGEIIGKKIADLFEKHVLSNCKNDNEKRISCAMLADLINMGACRKVGATYDLDNSEFVKEVESGRIKL